MTGAQGLRGIGVQCYSVLPLAVLLVGCARSAPVTSEATAPHPEESCRIVIPPSSSSSERLPPSVHSPSVDSSRILVHAEAPLAGIKQELETTIEPRLATVRGASVGFAGTVNYTVDRGPFALAVEGSVLVVSTQVRADVEVCSRGSCYASCKPSAIARAHVPLTLLSNYRFAPARVTATFTRGCKIRALNGFLTIDVTPQLEAAIAPTLRRVEKDVDRQLPDLKPDAERLWSELSKTRQVPLLGCVVVQPRGIVQGPPQATPDTLRLSFALLAAPELRLRCDEQVPANALPRLVQDPALSNDEDEVLLGLVSPLAQVESAFETSAPIELGSERFRVERASVASAGSAIDADLSLQGTVCGSVALRASPSWSRDGRTLQLAFPDLQPGQKESIAATSLEPKSLALALAGAPRIGVLLDKDRIKDFLPVLASSLSNGSVDVTATVSAVRPAEAAARDEDLVAWLAIRGQLLLRQQ